MREILENCIQCKVCGDVIESKSVHDFKTCSCGACSVDGGLAYQDLNDIEAIKKIGQGWVAEETFSIAVYCSLKYPNDFVKAVTTSVNHDGESDSTGAVTGNIIGAYLEQQHIPDKFIEPLDLKEVISEI